MKVEEIEKLLEAFYEGNATEQQEEALKDYFRTADVPSHLQREKKFFLGLYEDACKDIHIPTGLEAKLGNLIDEKYEEELRFFCPNKAKWNWRWVTGIAASILLLFGLSYSIVTYYQEECPPTPQDTFTDPEVAYEVLQATLLEVSTNLNKGISQVRETQKDVKRVNQEIKNELKK